MNTRTNQKLRKGFTLTEIAIVLGVIGLIIGAIWGAAKMVFDANKANQAAQDITTIATNIRSTFVATNQFSAAGLTDATSSMVTAGVIPSNLLTSDPANPKNAWNGSVKVYLNPQSNNNRVFRVSYYNTPADACVRIASQVANLGTNDAPTQLVTASGAGSATILNSGNNVGLSTTTINTTCQANSGVSGGAMSTEFDFKIH